MNLTYAVDRLFDSGWTPSDQLELELLPDGRRFPSVLAVQGEFARAGIELSIKQNLIFKCYRAIWHPVGEALDEKHAADDRHGTVVGACPREAAVYAYAQLRAAGGAAVRDALTSAKETSRRRDTARAGN